MSKKAADRIGSRFYVGWYMDTILALFDYCQVEVLLRATGCGRTCRSATTCSGQIKSAKIEYMEKTAQRSRSIAREEATAPSNIREWLNLWAHEIHDVVRIGRIGPAL